MALRFVVNDVFNIQSRGGLILTGTVTGGDIRVGTELHQAGGGAHLRVIAIELHHRKGLVGVVVERGEAAAGVTPGTLLTSLDRP